MTQPLTRHSASKEGPPSRPSGNDAWLPSMRLQVRVSSGSASRLAWSLYKCAALWKALYAPFAPERPLGTIREEKGISSGLVAT